MGSVQVRRWIGCGLVLMAAASWEYPAPAQRAQPRSVPVDTPAEWGQQHSAYPQAILRTGPSSYVFRVRPGDRWLQESPANAAERSEISHHRFPMGSDIWFAFDMTILSGLPSKAKWVVVGQLHNSPNPGDSPSSPPWAQTIYPGRRFTIQIRHSQQMPIRHNPPPVTLFTDPTLAQGRRYAFVYRLRYDPEDGALDAWRDGQKIVTYRGPLGYPSKIGPYLKFGIYRAKAPDEMDAAFTNIRTGVSVCAVIRPSQRLPGSITGCRR